MAGINPAMTAWVRFVIFPGMLEPNRGSRVVGLAFSSRRAYSVFPNILQTRGNPMVITAAHITPLVSLIAGILILVMPRLLNFIVAIYLIIVGVMGLNAIYHFVQ
jgi:hypothetical protein